MRKYVIAGNWKMNMTPSQTKAFISELAPRKDNYYADQNQKAQG